jgi:polysaccharide biosynthesis protein PslH
MRVLALCHQFPYPADNGGKLRTVHLLRQLASHHQVAVLGPDVGSPPAADFQRFLGPEATVALVPWPSDPDRRVAGTYFSSLPRDVIPAPEGSATLRAIDGWITTWAPDALLATDPVVGEFLRPYPGCARIVDIAAEYTLYIQRTVGFAPLVERPLWRLRELKWAAYMRSLGRCVDLWAVPAPVDRAALRRLLPAAAQVAVVPNGVDVVANAFAPNADAPPHIAHCGSLRYEPNRDAMGYFCREIWPLVRRDVPAVHLTVTGDSDRAPRELASAPGVTLTGHLPEVRSVLRACRATVVPLRIGVGTRLKILEAMALGTPVVATSRGAEGLEVGDGEHLLIGDTPAAFAAAVVRVLNEREVRVRLAHAARQRVEERYAWDVIGVALRTALADLMERRAGAASAMAPPDGLGAATGGAS